jgi:hypothetical protein
MERKKENEHRKEGRKQRGGGESRGKARIEEIKRKRE